MSVIDELITDRTQADIDNLVKLLRKDLSLWTQEELQWFKGAKSKGAYNYTDLNRVTEAMDYLNDLFTGYGYSTGYKPIKVDQETSVLPDGYIQLEYIQSSGNQYIDTGFKPNEDSRVVMDITLLSQADASVGLFGVRDVNGANAELKFIFWSMQTGTQIRSDFFGTFANATSNTSIVGKRINIDKNKTVCVVKQSDSESVLATLNSQPSTGQCNQNMYLLGVNTAGEADYFCTSKLYGCQIYGDGTLVRSFVPCISPNRIVGLYDTVTRHFYGNAGSGEFIAGPTKKVTFLEYIESSGAQYIDTAFKPNQNSKIEITFQTTQTTSGGVAVCDTSWGNAGFGIWVNAAVFGNNVTQDVVFYGEEKTTVILDRGALYKDGGRVWSVTATAFQTVGNLTLMCLNRNNAKNEYLTGKLYACKIYDNGVLIRDYRPAIDMNGLLGLYDIENKTFYSNAGSGGFVAGPEIVTPSRPNEYTWIENDVPTASQMTQYISNVAALRGTISVLSTTPATPDSMELLDYIKANNIEQILIDINQLIINMSSAWFYSGDLYAGEV